MVPAAGGAVRHSSSPRTSYEAALAALRHTTSFRFTERVDLTSPVTRKVESEVRFRAPNRIQMLVKTLAPPPLAALESVQVGRITCQQPPGTCYRGKAADPVRSARSLIQPQLPLTYRLAHDGGKTIMLLSATRNGLRYFARLTVGADGLPTTFASTITQNGAVIARQHGTFAYGEHFDIHLPPQAAKVR